MTTEEVVDYAILGGVACIAILMIAMLLAAVIGGWRK